MTEPTFTSAEVCAKLGLSIQQLNRLAHTGRVTSQPGEVGSGNYRRWTLDEVRRLRACLTRVRAAQEILSDWTSGKLWEETS
jgi:hypothetical protein